MLLAAAAYGQAVRLRDAKIVVVIRCTQKLLRRVDASGSGDVSSTTRLGDWSANLLGVRQQRFVLLVSECSRLPVLLPARDVRHIAQHLADALALVLQALGVSSFAIRRELEEMRESVIASTNNRSVLGSVNDFAKAAKWRLHEEPDADLIAVALWLSETPILALGGDSPDVLTRGLLK